MTEDIATENSVSLKCHKYAIDTVDVTTVDREKFVVKKILYQPFFNEIKAHKIFKIIIFN